MSGSAALLGQSGKQTGNEDHVTSAAGKRPCAALGQAVDGRSRLSITHISELSVAAQARGLSGCVGLSSSKTPQQPGSTARLKEA